MSDPSFYNIISQVAHKDVLEFLHHNRTEIIIKVFGQFIKTSINSRKNEKQLAIPKFNSYEFSNESITCLFQIKDDRYFFKSHLNSTNTDYSIDIPNEIYQLQRRNDYRVAMPIGVIYNCEIQMLNQTEMNVKAEIRDLSLGGCQISLQGLNSEFKESDRIELYLKLDKFEFYKLAIEVRHIKFIESQDNTLIGASFSETNSEVNSQMLALLMHLDRVQRLKSD